MSQIIKTIATILLVLTTSGCVTVGRQKIHDYRLMDQNGLSHSLRDYAQMKAVVFISHVNGCPIVEKGYPSVASMQDSFAPHGVVFLYLNASPQDDLASLQEETKTFSIKMPILKDNTQELARYLEIKRSAEAVILVPPNWQIAYRGPLDDRFDYLGERSHNVRNFLFEALQNIVAGRPVPKNTNETKGCLIGVEYAK